MKNYTHLSLPLREILATKFNAGESYRAISRALEISHSTVIAEIRRNKSKASNKVITLKKVGNNSVRIVDRWFFYDPVNAQTKADARAAKPRKRHKLTPGNELHKLVGALLVFGWKPSVIAGYLGITETDPNRRISYEAIYQHGYRYPESKWSQYFFNGRNKRRPHSKRRKPFPAGRVSITERPLQALERKELGHFELDTVIGAQTRGKVIHTMVCMATRKMFAHLNDNKTASTTNNSVLSMLGQAQVAKTITCDNGLEFAQHQEITAQTSVPFFFCDPYSSWQRGTNERHNGLIRRFLPKKTSFQDLLPEELQEIVDFWNNYPRKVLGWLTPNQEWSRQLAKLETIPA